ncbi:hypothetical protein FB382_001845 [Nocardioides ginsengisegetis]|uniref:AbiEi antitoxin C-terminal domain-containing protein n=1 Tax=Nocardioides ginsengisegetis TaxID=661491 RepID=A0A7W3IZR4_9ACTN|nr:hypothetical protein [Nocardioides ginsengisegetis]MBA8803554.1 hypothetical protein [Nocardioides ginsengisegetis]
MRPPPSWLPPDLVLLDERCPLPLDRPFTADQAAGLGVSRWFIRLLMDRALIRPILRGTYVVTQVRDCVDLRAAALRLVIPESAIVTDRTAAWLLGVDILPRSAVHAPPPLDVFSSTCSRLRRPGVASGTRQFLPRDLTVVHGVRVTTPLRTALDLGRRLWRFDALAALDGFLRIGVDHDELLAEVERFRGERGVVQLRWLAPLADGRSESVGESVLRLHWYDAGLPKPELQWWVHDETGAPVFRLDLAHPELRYAAEYNGERFHSGDEAEGKDAHRLEWLESRDSWLLDVFTGADVFGLQATAPDRLLAGFHRARQRCGLWVPESAYRDAQP